MTSVYLAFLIQVCEGHANFDSILLQYLYSCNDIRNIKLPIEHEYIFQICNKKITHKSTLVWLKTNHNKENITLIRWFQRYEPHHELNDEVSSLTTSSSW